MTPLDLLLSALAFLAGALGLWLTACFVIAAVVLFKPRGKAANAHVVMRDRDPQVRS